MVKTKREIQSPLKNSIVLTLIDKTDKDFETTLISKASPLDVKAPELKTLKIPHQHPPYVSQCFLGVGHIVKRLLGRMSQSLRLKAHTYKRILLQQSSHDIWNDPYAIPIKIRVDEKRLNRLK